MAGSKRWFATSSVFLLSFLILASDARGQTPEAPETPCTLCFWVRPERQLYADGEPVVLVLSIYNWSAKPAEPIFVSRLEGDEFVDLNVIGPDGKEVPWQGKRRAVSREYSPADFVVLGTYQEISAKRIISLQDGAGFVFDKPGEYFVTGEYSLGPPEYLAPFAGETKIPTGTFRSTKAGFCIEACIREPLRVRSNNSQSALAAVRVFYTHITKYQPLGIPEGHAKKALRPLLSTRLAEELDSLQACEDDYYRRYGDVLRANQYKPATPWLEEGLFSGSNEAASPMKFWVLSSRAIGENRVDVHLKFIHKQSYCCGHPPSYEHYEGLVSTILENDRWVIDDFVAMDGNDELHRLSDGYAQCKGGLWVGEKPY
jgi:hypothetical protein